jgi:hypothetical protein
VHRRGRCLLSFPPTTSFEPKFQYPGDHQSFLLACMAPSPAISTRLPFPAGRALEIGIRQPFPGGLRQRARCRQRRVLVLTRQVSSDAGTSSITRNRTQHRCPRQEIEPATHGVWENAEHREIRYTSSVISQDSTRPHRITRGGDSSGRLRTRDEEGPLRASPDSFRGWIVEDNVGATSS